MEDRDKNADEDISKPLSLSLDLSLTLPSTVLLCVYSSLLILHRFLSTQSSFIHTRAPAARSQLLVK